MLRCGAGLYSVQCRKLKEQLISASQAAVHQLLDIVCNAARESTLRIADEYAVSVEPSLTGYAYILNLQQLLPTVSCMACVGTSHPAADETLISGWHLRR